MSAREFTVALFGSLCFVSSAPAQNALAWKFETGLVFQAERTATQKETVELTGKVFTQQRRSVWHVRLDVKDKRADHFVVVATLTKVEQQLTGEAEKLDAKLSEKMQGSVFSLQVTPQGRIIQLRGYEDFLKRLAGHDKAQLKALRTTFSEESLKDALADLFGPLPDKEKSWQREYVEPIPHFGALRSTAKYEHVGTEQGRDVIDYTIQTRYEIPKADRAGLFRIVKGTISADQARGSITFDKAAGFLVEHERTMLLRGTLTIETMDRQQPIEFRSENAVRIRMRKQ